MLKILFNLILVIALNQLVKSNELNNQKIDVSSGPSASSSSSAASSEHVNFLSYSEIKNYLQIYPTNYQQHQQQKKPIEDFNEIKIDYQHKYLYIGAKNHLVRLTFENDSLELVDSNDDLIYWPPNTDALNECKKSMTSASLTNKYCQNYIRVIALTNETDKTSNRLLVCGTYATRPMCTWRQGQHIKQVIETFDGIGKVPHLPDLSLSYLIDYANNSNELYFGTSIDYSEQGMKADYLIEKTSSRLDSEAMIGGMQQLRTDQYNSNWLNDPTFVGSLTIGNYVYFFIRETAIEYMNCGEKVYSRVIRLCKYDQGIENVLIWKRFEKATLNCSIGSSTHSSTSFSSNNYMNLNKNENQYPFYFDEIQSVYYDKKRNLIYALFSTQSNSIKSTALCVYDQASLDRAFNGPFKHQKTKDSIWMPFYDEQIHQKSESSKCEPSSHQTPNKYQLKHLSVQPLYQRPLLVLPYKQITKLVVDKVFSRHQTNIDVLFLATETNTILKYMLLNLDAAIVQSEQNHPTLLSPLLCHLEEIEIFEKKKHNNLINNMALLDSSTSTVSMKSLVVATSENVIKMPLANCLAQTNYFSCLSSMDPYCLWDSKAQKCVLIFSTESSLNNRLLTQHLHQHQITTCPSASLSSLPVDGGFSEWSAWTTCTSKDKGEKCKCRHRLCNSPAPRNGGKACDESQSIEIGECQVDGGWTMWSAWSSCKKANCDSPQSPSMRTRFRTCTNPEPKNNGRLCVGLDQEEEVCTQEMINPCHNSQLGQQQASSAQWMSWGSWEECSRPCGEGFQMRRRLCNGKACLGCNQEWRSCNTEPCKDVTESMSSDWDTIEINVDSKQKLEKRFKFTCRFDHYMEANSLDAMEMNASSEYRLCHTSDEKSCTPLTNLKELGTFTQWTEWSQCKKCGDKQHRTRRCQVHGTCFGHEKETKDCKCDENGGFGDGVMPDGGWTCWSEFSECSVGCGKGIQKRTRQCRFNNNPIVNCHGQKEEIATCYATNCSFYDSLSKGFVGQNKIGTFNLTHLIIVSIFAFLLGSIFVLIIIYLSFKRNKNNRSSLFCCCCSSTSSKNTNNSNKNSNNHKRNSLNRIKGKKQDKHLFSSSLDHQSSENGTDLLSPNIDTSTSKFCTSSDSSSNSGAASNHSKEYFTINNNNSNNLVGLTSLLNDVIPDDDDDDDEDDDDPIEQMNQINDDDDMMNIGLTTLSRNGRLNAANSGKLPAKSFNTYTNQKDMLTLSTSGNKQQNTKNSTSNIPGMNNLLSYNYGSSQLTSLNNNPTNTLSRYSTNFLMNSGSISKSASVSKQRGGGGFGSNSNHVPTMRTNLDQDL